MKQSLLVAALFSLFLAACGDKAATPEASATASEVAVSEVAPEAPAASEEVAPAASEEVAPAASEAAPEASAQ